MTMRLLSWVLFALVALGAETWPQFRGPGGLGVGSETAVLPSEFGPGKALLWKTELPLGHGSPCVWGDRIFVTAFDKANQKLEVVAVNRKDGKIVWRRAAPAGGLEKVHDVSSPATSTPVTDGERIYVYFGSHGLLAYDWDGKLAWDYPMGTAKSPYGSGASPVLAGDLVLLTRDYPPDPYMIAVGRKTGVVAWKAELPKSNQGGPRTAHSTPVIWHEQIILNRPGEVAGHSLKDGARIWWFATQSFGTSTPTTADGVVYVNAFSMSAEPGALVPLPAFALALEKYDLDKDGKLSNKEMPGNDLFLVKRVGMPDGIPGAHLTVKLFFGAFDSNKDGSIDEAEYSRIGETAKMLAAFPGANGLLAIRPVGEGALAGTALEWAEKRSVPEITAPLVYRGRVYMVTAGGIVSCVDGKTGKVIYRGRVNAPGAYYASPVAAGGKVFVASADGVVSVLGGGETLEILANNDLGEPVYGTPALIGSTIYLRSAQHLWAFGTQSN